MRYPILIILFWTSSVTIAACDYVTEDVNAEVLHNADSNTSPFGEEATAGTELGSNRGESSTAGTDSATENGISSDTGSEVVVDTGFDPESELYWIDEVNGLVWQKEAPAEFIWRDAQNYCETLTLDGHSNWRLPTIAEQRSVIQGCDNTETGGECGVADDCLADSCGSSPACDGCVEKSLDCYLRDELKIQGIICANTGLRWSASLVADNEENTWGMHFGTARIFNGSGGHAYVQCVADTVKTLDTDTTQTNCAPLWDLSQLKPDPNAFSDECCTNTGFISECLLEDAADDGLTCTADDLSNCAPGQSCSPDGLCTCTDSCQCGTGRCSTLGVCLPSACNGFYVCNCFGGCSWWDGNSNTNTPADDAAALGMVCCDSYASNGKQGVTFSADPSCDI